MEKIRYSNDWAVEVHGGSEMADQIARRFGFINLGQVTSIATMYQSNVNYSIGNTYIAIKFSYSIDWKSEDNVSFSTGCQ